MAKDILCPNVLDPPEATLQSLYDWAEEHFSFTQKDVKDIMAYYGIEKFSVGSWWLYVSLIKHVYMMKQAGDDYPLKGCPICGAEIEHDLMKDNRFGVHWGWRCTADQFHFMKTRMRALRDKLKDAYPENSPVPNC